MLTLSDNFGLLHNLDRVETMHSDEEGGVPLMRNGAVSRKLRGMAVMFQEEMSRGRDG